MRHLLWLIPLLFMAAGIWCVTFIPPGALEVVGFYVLIAAVVLSVTVVWLWFIAEAALGIPEAPTRTSPATYSASADAALVHWRCKVCHRFKPDICTNGCTRCVDDVVPLEPIDADGRPVPYEQLCGSMGRVL